MEKDESLIPQGPYCYSGSAGGKISVCPYWEEHGNKAADYWLSTGEITQEEADELKKQRSVIQGSGYCHYL